MMGHSNKRKMDSVDSVSSVFQEDAVSENKKTATKFGLKVFKGRKRKGHVRYINILRLRGLQDKLYLVMFSLFIDSIRNFETKKCNFDPKAPDPC